MKLAAKVKQILEPYAVKNGFKYTIVFEAGRNDVAMTFFNETLFGRLSKAVGYTVEVDFDINSREWNGKWFTEALLFDAFYNGKSLKETAKTAPPPSPPPPVEEIDQDLPF